MTIRPVQQTDAKAWEEMRRALWPEHPDDHAKEIEEYFNGTLREPIEVLLAFDDTNKTIGFIELNIRPYAEGCYSGKVAYLEGWYVKPEARGRGVGSALVAAGEEWGCKQGCSEIASDAELTNDVSIALHKKLGYTEVERQVCFRKDL